MLKRVAVESAAEAYLELLAARGIEHFFGNAGTDFAPIVEAYAKRLAQGTPLPRPMTVPHEVTAVAMAHAREVLAELLETLEYSDPPRAPRNSATVAEAAAIAEAARTLADARNPLIIAKAPGRDPAAVAPLVRLAEALGAPHFDHWPTHVNFPQQHPLHAGYDPAPYLAEADVILAVESDVPWIPKLAAPRPEAKVTWPGSRGASGTSWTRAPSW